MKILLLGASGRTGRLILKELLKTEHQIYFQVRNINKIDFDFLNAEAVIADPNDESFCQKYFSQVDIIICALNVSRNTDWPWSQLRSPKNLLSSTAKNLNLYTSNNTQIIYISAWGVNESWEDIPFWFRWTVKYSQIKWPYQDHGLAENEIRSGNNTYTIYRPVGLINAAPTHKVKLIFDRKTQPKLTISRADLAWAVVEHFANSDFKNATVVISK